MKLYIKPYRGHYINFTLFTDGDEFVGICCLDYPPIEKPKLIAFPYDFGYFYNFRVEEQHRGKGYGKLLFKRMLRYAKENGFPGVYWVVEEPYVDLALPHHNLYNKYAVKIEASVRWYVEF